MSCYKKKTVQLHSKMTSRNFEHFLIPLPHRHAFYYWGLSTILTKSLNPSLPLDRDVIHGRPLPQFKNFSGNKAWDNKDRNYFLTPNFEVIRTQFHQRFKSSFCANILAPKKVKPRVKCWWNWHQVEIWFRTSSFVICYLYRDGLKTKVINKGLTFPSMYSVYAKSHVVNHKLQRPKKSRTDPMGNFYILVFTKRCPVWNQRYKVILCLEKPKLVFKLLRFVTSIRQC
jgi:hypothetical protein